MLDYNNTQDGESRKTGERESSSRRLYGADDEAVSLEVNGTLDKTHLDSSRGNSSAVLNELRDELRVSLNSKLQDLLHANNRCGFI